MSGGMKSTQMLCCSLLIATLLVSVYASRPAHLFPDTAQRSTGDQDTPNDLSPINDHRYAMNQLIDSDTLANLRLQLLAQQLSNLGSNDIETLMPSKRQQQLRFRQCYFNPISCFRK